MVALEKQKAMREEAERTRAELREYLAQQVRAKEEAAAKERAEQFLWAKVFEVRHCAFSSLPSPLSPPLLRLDSLVLPGCTGRGMCKHVCVHVCVCMCLYVYPVNGWLTKAHMLVSVRVVHWLQ